MQLKIQRKNDKVVIYLTGTLDGSSACQVEHALERELREGEAARLVVDLSRVRNFEYFGIATFAKIVRGQKTSPHKITLIGLPRSTENVFRRFGLENKVVAQD